MFAEAVGIYGTFMDGKRTPRIKVTLNSIYLIINFKIIDEFLNYLS